MLRFFSEPKIKKAVFIYFIAVAVYAIAASLMKVAPHVRVDEDLYMSLAKSLFKGDGFIVHGQISDYTSVLYSMIISVAYSVYSPGTILLTIRIMNAFIMCSVIFPVYLLSKELLEDKYVMCVCIFSILIPDMIDIVYIMQENLYYPLAIWCFYFIYRDIKEECFNRYTVISTLALTLLYFTKNVGLSFAIGYFVILIIKGFASSSDRTHKQSEFVKPVASTILYAAILTLWKLLIWMINGFAAGENHYVSQLSRLFPITGRTFAAGCIGLAVYAVFFLLCTGILPAVIPLLNLKSFEDSKERSFLIYIYISVILTVLETVFLIFITEEEESYIPHKFLFRYLFPVLVILVIYMIRCMENMAPARVRIIAVISLITFAGAAIYYLIVGTEARNSLCDSHVNLLLETANKIINPRFTATLLFLAGICIVVIVTVIKKKTGENSFNKTIIKTWCITAAILLALYVPINAFQHVYYSRKLAQGTIRQEDYIKFADKIGKSDTKVYVIGRIHVPECMMFGYIWQDYVLIEKPEYVTIDAEPGGIVVTSKGSVDEIPGCHRLDDDYRTMDVWVVE